MGLRRIIILISALSLMVVSFGAPPASAKPITALVVEEFSVSATIYNDAPPTKILGFRLYLDGDNFSVNEVTAFSPNQLGKRINEFGIMGLKVLPILTTYTLNGAASDFNGAVIEDCQVHVTGLLLNVNTNINQDQPLSLRVDTTCPV